jgi:hypothetical protein
MDRVQQKNWFGLSGISFHLIIIDERKLWFTYIVEYGFKYEWAIKHGWQYLPFSWRV